MLKKYVLQLNVKMPKTPASEDLEEIVPYSIDFEATPENFDEKASEAAESLFGELVAYVTSDVGMDRISFHKIYEMIPVDNVPEMFQVAE